MKHMQPLEYLDAQKHEASTNTINVSILKCQIESEIITFDEQQRLNKNYEYISELEERILDMENELRKKGEENCVLRGDNQISFDLLFTDFKPLYSIMRKKLRRILGILVL